MTRTSVVWLQRVLTSSSDIRLDEMRMLICSVRFIKRKTKKKTQSRCISSCNDSVRFYKGRNKTKPKTAMLLEKSAAGWMCRCSGWKRRQGGENATRRPTVFRSGCYKNVIGPAAFSVRRRVCLEATSEGGAPLSAGQGAGRRGWQPGLLRCHLFSLQPLGG